jgi:membrane-associated protease RseP (regulator of RpoE activity)
MKKLARLIAVLAVFAAGCVTALPTPSGAPEVTIHAPRKYVANLFANAYSNDGFTVKTANDFTLVVEKPNQSLAASLLFGSRFSGTPNVRVSLSFADTNDGTHVRARVEAVTNPGSGFEQTTDLSGTAGDLLKQFQMVKAELEGGAVGVRFDHALKVTEVVAGSPAAQAGIAIGDEITSIGGVAMSSYEAAAIALRGDPGTPVTIDVKRTGSPMSFSITRRIRADIYGKTQ